MNTNLLESTANQLTPQMIQKVSLFLGETPAQTQKAVDKAIPTVFAGLIHFSSSTTGPTQLLHLLNQANYGRLLNNLSGLCDEGDTAQNVMTAGQEIVRVVFTDKLDVVSEKIAAASGVTHASASSLLSLTAPVVVGMVERARAMQGLNAAGLITTLMSQKEEIFRLAPTGLADVFGVSDLTNLGRGPIGLVTTKTPDPVRHRAAAPVKEKSGLKKWLWPIFGAVVLGLAYLFVGRDVGVTQSLMGDWKPATTPAVATVTLPSGTALSLQEGSFNYNVAKFLAAPARMTVPKTFVFDPVRFDPGTTRFTSESVQTIEELSAILKAYPAVEVRIDGHTDDARSTEDSKKLSQDQATTVQETLIAKGISTARVTTAGYGQEYPLTSNETEAGRAKNQRLELVVVKK